MNIREKIARDYPDQVVNASKCRISSAVTVNGARWAIEPDGDGWRCRLLCKLPMATRRKPSLWCRICNGMESAKWHIFNRLEW